MNVRPLHDWILIELEEAKTKKGSIILPDPDRAPLRIGKVIRTGPGRILKVLKKGPDGEKLMDGGYRPVDVKPGDRVVFPMAVTECGSGQNITHTLDNGQRMIREDDVFFVIDGNEDIHVEV